MEQDNRIYTDYQEFLKDANSKKKNFDYVQESLVNMNQVDKKYLSQMFAVAHEDFIEEKTDQ